ncbi:MAG: glycosyltransferase [Cyanobacteria bacterium P01_G01_bin.38]
MTAVSSKVFKPVTINVVTGKGGGGHYATYHALRAIAQQRDLPWQFRVTDMDDIMESITQQREAFNLYKLLGSSVSDLYNQMLKRGWTWLWPLQMRLNKLLVKLNYKTGVEFFEGYWREQQPDLVISVVTMCNKVLWEALQRANPGTPYVTLPIDFADSPPGFWFEPDTDSFALCGTDKAVEQARIMGVKASRIVPTSGMVIHPRFYAAVAGDAPEERLRPNASDAPRAIRPGAEVSVRTAERRRLGLAPHKLTGLVMFGGNGSQVMVEIAKRLESYFEDLQLIYLCGRNEPLMTALRQLPNRQSRLIVGFTQDIPDYMRLADFFIGKPGPGSLSEALVMQLPVITVCNAATLVHERYNAEWVRSQDVGIVLKRFRHIAQAVDQFLQPEILYRYQTNVAAINNRAVFEVADFIQQVLAMPFQNQPVVPLQS